jgi:hypothetical protein
VSATPMDKWVRMFATRDELAVEYAKLLRDRGPHWKTWPILNIAIVDRWSASGLVYIKKKAWKLAASPDAGTDSDDA